MVGDAKHLHERVLSYETHLLTQPNTDRRPLFAAKFPQGFSFVDTFPADLILLRFEDIFGLFHLHRLDSSLIRYHALHQAYMISKESNSNIAIADPYHLYENMLTTPQGTQMVLEYIVDTFMQQNRLKEIMLLPFTLK